MIRGLTTHSFAIVCALLLGVWLGHEYEEQYGHSRSLQVFSRGGGGGLTNPLLECGVEAEELDIGERKEIEDSVNTYVNQELKHGSITHAAIYFRDLNNGPWFGINEREAFEPGSLLKLPIAMSIYYWGQRAHGVLGQTVDLSQGPAATSSPSNNAAETLVPPGVYSVRDLIGIMLRESNNDAANVLAEFEGQERLTRIFSDLGIDPPTKGSSYVIDVKTFGAFFRVLYNASYVGQPASEEILSILIQTTFRDGLVAGVPSTIKVAHKYGTRIVDDASGRRQLHDCGIVYAEKTPYVLCVMTQGDSVKNLERFIAGVSKRVYEGVAK